MSADEPAGAPDRDERRRLATLSDDPAVLRQLAQDSIWRVRQAVAHNPVTPPDALEFLARDDHALVRTAVLDHPSCPPPVVVELLRDAKRPVREKAMARTDAPLAQLIELTARYPYAVEIVAQRARDPSTHSLLMNATDPDVRVAVVQSGSATVDTLRRSAIDPDTRVQIAVARLDKLPKSVARILARSDRPTVLRALSERRDLPRRTCARLLRSDDSATVESIARNPRLPRSASCARCCSARCAAAG